ncbi:MAG TPA: hypothetical protein PK765_06570 [bacterium]|nr:hypothetical protein [bacterium]
MEFNGDMYPEGYGDIAFELLREVQDAESFEAMILKFNAQAHKYRDETTCFRGDIHEMRRHIDMTKDSYYDFWFSDWIFIKNLSGRNFPLVVKKP